jgi:hypothetical protein
MKLKDFVEKLKKIEREYGGNLGVVMADFIPVVDPSVLNYRDGRKKVVITDQTEDDL